MAVVLCVADDERTVWGNAFGDTFDYAFGEGHFNGSANCFEPVGVFVNGVGIWQTKLRIALGKMGQEVI